MDEEALQLLRDLSRAYSNLHMDMEPHNPADYSVQDEMDRGKSLATKSAAEEEEDEAQNFASYVRHWESIWGKICGSFEDMTALSSMQFTYYTPGRHPPNDAARIPPTLQILSVKLAQVTGSLIGWPLSVYGVVAVRDVVDHNRNFLFNCDRDESQQLTEDDPFFRLVGPSRAVLYTDMINFEIQLKVKGTTETQDKALITEGHIYHEAFGAVSTICFQNCFCTIEACLQVVEKTTQATLLGVQVAKAKGRPCPFQYGARVTCSPLPGKSVATNNPASGKIVMVDSKDGELLKGSDGYLHLPRTVISVESRGRLDVEIQAYSESGEIAAQDHVSFEAKRSKITRKKCFIHGVMVVITVAWSRVAVDKNDFMALGSLV